MYSIAFDRTFCTLVYSSPLFARSPKLHENQADDVGYCILAEGRLSFCGSRILVTSALGAIVGNNDEYISVDDLFHLHHHFASARVLSCPLLLLYVFLPALRSLFWRDSTECITNLLSLSMTPRPSGLKELRYQNEVRDNEYGWIRKYGTAWRSSRPLGWIIFP
ncbi:hypothetical protein BGW80DRAFT_506998 [Lactifluus volemus]|nr:hypothetical protein BGW80DRAFT_506998 [Lactifluus volemus]